MNNCGRNNLSDLIRKANQNNIDLIPILGPETPSWYRDKIRRNNPLRKDFRNLMNLLQYNSWRSQITEVDATTNDYILSIVEKSPDILNFSNRTGQTLIHQACLYGNLTIIQRLLHLGGNLHQKNNNGYDAFHMAVAQQRDINIISYLLDLGANPCSVGEEFTVLGTAAWNCDLPICLLLLSRGADLRTKMTGYGDLKTRTALDFYCSSEWRSRDQRENGCKAMCNAFLQHS